MAKVTLQNIIDGKVARCTDVAMQVVAEAEAKYGVLYVPQMSLDLPDVNSVKNLFVDDCDIRYVQECPGGGNTAQTTYGVYVFLEITSSKGTCKHSAYLTFGVKGEGESAKIGSFGLKETDFKTADDDAKQEMTDSQKKTAQTVSKQLFDKKGEIFDVLMQEDEALKEKMHNVSYWANDRFTVSMEFTRLVVGAVSEKIGIYEARKSVAGETIRVPFKVVWSQNKTEFQKDRVYVYRENDGTVVLTYDETKGLRWVQGLNIGLFYRNRSFRNGIVVPNFDRRQEQFCPQCNTTFYAADTDWKELIGKNVFVTIDAQGNITEGTWGCLTQTGVVKVGERYKKITKFANTERWIAYPCNSAGESILAGKGVKKEAEVGDFYFTPMKEEVYEVEGKGKDTRCYYCNRLMGVNLDAGGKPCCQACSKGGRKDKLRAKLKEMQQKKVEAETKTQADIDAEQKELDRLKKKHEEEIRGLQDEKKAIEKTLKETKEQVATQITKAKQKLTETQKPFERARQEFQKSLVANAMIYRKKIAKVLGYENFAMEDIKVRWFGRDENAREMAYIIVAGEVLLFHDGKFYVM